MTTASPVRSDSVARMRVALTVAYDGAGFHGLARQPKDRSVQEVLEDALTSLARTPVKLIGAGRTDTGVHAWGQVVSFDVPAGTSVERLIMRLNRWLGPEIAIRGGAVVADDFSARYDAGRRIYEYRMYRGAFRDPFRDRFALHVPDVSVAQMRIGARALIGEHDFSAFCRRGQLHPMRRVRRATLAVAGDSIVFRIEADSFCQQMVRAVTGILLDVGRARRPASDVAAVLAKLDRAHGSAVAAARGLHLVEVRYPRARYVMQAAKPPDSNVARSQ